VPETVAAQVEVWPVVIDAGVAVTLMEVTVDDAAVTAMFAEPETFV
jgi:hypothetical protein